MEPDSSNKKAEKGKKSDKGEPSNCTWTIECSQERFPEVSKQVKKLMKKDPVQNVKFKVTEEEPTEPIEMNFYCTPSSLPLVKEHSNVPGFKYAVAVEKSPDQCRRCTLALNIESDSAPQRVQFAYGRKQINYEIGAAEITTEITTVTRTLKRTMVTFVGSARKMRKNKRKREDDDELADGNENKLVKK